MPLFERHRSDVRRTVAHPGVSYSLVNCSRKCTTGKILPAVGALFLSSFLPIIAAPKDPSAKQLVAQMERLYSSPRTMQAVFLERYTENHRVVRSEAGKAYFRRPGKMRWEYESPEKDLFLVDGKTAWFYVPEDHTVSRVPARESTDLRTPLALLAGEMRVSRVCERVELATSEKAESQDHAMLECQIREPRADHSGQAAQKSATGHTENDTVFFEIVRDTGELVRLIVRQSGGVQVEFRFENWRFDPPVPDSLFRFEPPRGVAIVNGELPAESEAVN